MTRSRIVLSVLGTLVCLAVLPDAAHAQSAIAGVVRDASGAVLPGASVEASSPALIEKTRSVVTDSQGSYKIVDLRPGVYTVTFTLNGFSTVKREGLELPSDFTMTVNADLKIGALAETITVTGESPVVDVQTNTRAAVLSRNTLDAVPNAHTLQSVGQLVVGVTLTAPDVGGSQAMQQTYFSVHGAGAAQTAVLMDGMIINGLQGDGAIQSYLNDAASQEMVYQTGGGAADSTSGGVKINLVPKEGGNSLHGSITGLFERSGAFPGQSDNLSASLSAAGVKTLDKIGLYRDIDATQGGPIVKDKLWFFASGRLFTVDKPISNTFHVPVGQTYANCVNGVVSCAQGVDDQEINSVLGRATWQVSPRNKFSMYADKLWKSRSSAMNPGDDPDTASVVWTSPLYLTDTAKWTSTVSNRAPRRRRLLQQHRAVREPLSAWHCPAVGHGRVARWRPLQRCRARDHESCRVHCHWRRSVSEVSGSVQPAGVRVVRLRFAQHQGRSPGLVGTRRQYARAERRSGPELPERRPVHGDPGGHGQPQDILDRQVEREPGHLRAGPVDVQAHDGQLRPAMGVRQRAGRRGATAGGPLCHHSGDRRHQDADLEELVSAGLGGVRPDGRREDRGPVRLQPVPVGSHDHVRLALRSGERAQRLRHRAVDRQERR